MKPGTDLHRIFRHHMSADDASAERERRIQRTLLRPLLYAVPSLGLLASAQFSAALLWVSGAVLVSSIVMLFDGVRGAHRAASVRNTA